LTIMPNQRMGAPQRILCLCAALMILIQMARPSHSLNAAALLAPNLASGNEIYLPLVARYYDSGYTSPFGVVMYGTVSAADGLPQMQTAGSRWITTTLHWDQIESVKGQRNWTTFDVKVINARASGADLFVLFTSNPTWAATYPGGPLNDLQDLVNMAGAMAERYDGDGLDDAPNSPVVNYWSFYAEPDNGDEARAPGGKGWWGNNGTGYAQLLSRVAPAIHAASPPAKVLIGGLAYDYFTTEGGPYVRSFLGDTLAALNAYPGGVTRYVDAFAFHYYPISTDRWPTLRDKANELRSILAQHGAGQLPLYVPEMGYWSDVVAGMPSLDSSPEKQAQRLVQMYVHGLSAGVLQMSWFAVIDHGAGTEAHGLFFDPALTQPKRAYTAYQTLARELAQARYLRALTATDIEGYIFRMPDLNEKTVLWGTGQQTAAWAYARSCARVASYAGSLLQITDGGSGDLDGPNGQVLLGVESQRPVFVAPCQ
jgi:hypothetical protein